MLRSIFVLLLLTPALHAQVKVSQYQPRWQDIPAPTMPLVIATPNTNSDLSGHEYKYPFTHGSPRGKWKASNAVVRKDQSVGAWSEEVCLDLQSGWRLYAGAWNQPSTADDAGIVYRIRAIDIEEDPLGAYVNGGEYLFTTHYESGLDSQLNIVPYSSARPELQLIREPNRRMTLEKLKYGGNQTVRPPPIIVATQIPLTAMKIAYSRVTHRGETELSPPVQFTPPIPPAGLVPAETCGIVCNIREPFLQGCLGYFLYIQIEGGTWQRLPSPACYGTPSTPDDWLWQPDNNQPFLVRTVPNAPAHTAVANPGSYLCALQVAITETAGNVIVDTPLVETFSPVIDEWGTGNDGLPHKFRRKITAPEGGLWKLKHTPAGINQSGVNYWPILLVYNSYSHWVGVECTGAKGSAALALADYQGGKAFGCRFTRCYFGILDTQAAGITQGMRVLSECSRQQGHHTASELYFEDCSFNGDVAIWLAGWQTANIRFNRTHASSFGRTFYVPFIGLALYGDRRLSAVYLDTPNQVVFTNGLFCDCPGNVIFSMTWGDVIADGLWVDQGFKSLVDIHAGNQGRLKINGGKLNAWSLVSERPNLARIFNPREISRLVFSDVVLQFSPDGAKELDIVHPLYDRLDLRFTDTLLSDVTVLREPTREQTAAEGAKIYSYPATSWPMKPYPGMKITLPTAEIQGDSLVTTSQAIGFNSLTGRQTVRRANWME